MISASKKSPLAVCNFNCLWLALFAIVFAELNKPTTVFAAISSSNAANTNANSIGQQLLASSRRPFLSTVNKESLPEDENNRRLQDILSRARNNHKFERVLLGQVFNKLDMLMNDARKQPNSYLVSRSSDLDSNALSSMLGSMLTSEPVLVSYAENSPSQSNSIGSSSQNDDRDSQQLTDQQQQQFELAKSEYLNGLMPSTNNKRTYNPCSFNPITCFRGRRLV